PLSLHAALPISSARGRALRHRRAGERDEDAPATTLSCGLGPFDNARDRGGGRPGVVAGTEVSAGSRFPGLVAVRRLGYSRRLWSDISSSLQRFWSAGASWRVLWPSCDLPRRTI